MNTNNQAANQYIELHPDNYVMVTYEFGNPLFIAPIKDSEINVTTNKNEAEIWDDKENWLHKLHYHIICTGYQGLQFERA